MSDAAVDAFYDALDGGRFFSTRATVGPWNPSLQHGGPPAFRGRSGRCPISGPRRCRGPGTRWPRW